MNKTIKTIAVLLAGLTLTAGTAVAAPRHGWGHRPHCPPPRQPRQHIIHHTHHHGGGNAGWVALGAAAVGAVVGGLIGAAAH